MEWSIIDLHVPSVMMMLLSSLGITEEQVALHNLVV